MSDTHKQHEIVTEDNLARELGQRLVRARSGLGLSQQAVHSRSKILDKDGLGVSRAVLSLYETGVNKPGAREISLLCKVLSITPNWLIFGSESPVQAIQPSLAFLQGDEINVSARLALGILALAPEERDAVSSLIFSLLTKSLGDVKLASLMSFSRVISEDMYKKILQTVGTANAKLSIQELIDLFIRQETESVYTNVGTLRPIVSEENIADFDPDFPPPPRTLKSKLQ